MYCCSGAQANAGEGIVLEDYQGNKIDLGSIREVSECIQLASNPDVVSDMEDITTVWCQQIEQVSHPVIIKCMDTLEMLCNLVLLFCLETTLL